jgi:23S rRNA pseudouridine1911/1915/1917 synthase
MQNELTLDHTALDQHTDKAVLTNYLKKNAVTNQVYLASETTEGAKKAELAYRTLEEKGGYTLTEVTLHTGRSHQIRVQMAGIGNPVFGDVKYGGEKAVKGNLALYAYSLKFTHPVTKELLVFLSEPPKELIPWKAFDVTKYVTILK